MKTIDLEKTALTITELVELAKKGPVVLTRKGKALTSVKDVAGSDWESVALANNPQFQALIEESRRSYREKGGVRLAELRKELGLSTNRGRTNGRRKKPSGRARQAGPT